MSGSLVTHFIPTVSLTASSTLVTRLSALELSVSFDNVRYIPVANMATNATMTATMSAMMILDLVLPGRETVVPATSMTSLSRSFALFPPNTTIIRMTTRRVNTPMATLLAVMAWLNGWLASRTLRVASASSGVKSIIIVSLRCLSVSEGVVRDAGRVSYR